MPPVKVQGRGALVVESPAVHALGCHPGRMRTVGIDLSADRSKTAVSIVEWRDGGAVISRPLLKCTDDELLDQLSDRRPGDQAGIDTPFGWPAEFVRAVGRTSVALPGRAAAKTANAIGRNTFAVGSPIV